MFVVKEVPARRVKVSFVLRNAKTRQKFPPVQVCKVCVREVVTCVCVCVCVCVRSCKSLLGCTVMCVPERKLFMVCPPESLCVRVRVRVRERESVCVCVIVE
jgi:hypothetical protein